MIGFVPVDDGDFDLECTIDELDSIKRLASDAAKNHADISELRSMRQSDVADLADDLQSYHDVPVPLTRRQALRLCLVIDAMRHRMVAGIIAEDRRDIVRQFDAIDWAQIAK